MFVCALAVTVLFVRRELAPVPNPQAPRPPEFHKDWKAFLAGGRVVSLLAVSFLVAHDRHIPIATEPSKLIGTVELVVGRGALESREAFLFEDVQGLAFGARGRLLVAEANSGVVRVFSSTGEFEYKVGQQGSGPGDLKRPCCISVAQDGVLWVAEAGNRRLSLFALGERSGKFLRNISLPATPSGLLTRIEWDSRGNSVAIITIRDTASRRFGEARIFISPDGHQVYSDTVLFVTVDSLRQLEFQRRVTVAGQTGFGTTVITQPYGPRALRAFGPGGDMALAVSSNYAVEWVDAKRKRIALLHRQVLAPVLSPAERLNAEQTLEAAAKHNGVPRSAMKLNIAVNKTPIKAIGFDLDGHLWVQRNVAEGHPNQADVYDRRGQWIQVMEWPGSVDLSLWAVRGRTALGMRRDEDGVEQPVRMLFH